MNSRVITLLLLAFAPTLFAAEPLPPNLLRLVKAHRGDVGVAIKHLPSGKTFAYRADEPMPTASLIKFPVMVEAYRQAESGELDLDEKITLEKSDKVPGSGVLTAHFSEGLQLSLRDAIRLMIVYSDNTATNLVAQRVGIPAINERMKMLGLPETRLNSLVYRGSTTSVDRARSQEFGLGSTTAAETVKLYEMLHANKLGSKESSKAMLNHLRACDEKTKLARDLPTGVTLAHKSGAVSRSRTDGGLLFTKNGPIAICVLTSRNEDRRWSDDNAALKLIGRLARLSVEHFEPSKDRDAPQKVVLSQGDHGRMVEALQRTLNTRLKPSPKLAVDGDFGANTERAVKAFQRESGLSESGRVDEKFWKQLGPLVAERPVPSPTTINDAKLSRSSRDPLLGPPHVTAKAWCLTDIQGNPIVGREANRSLDMASTTKVMTAVLVLDYAKTHPEAWSETVTFSPRADNTVGSTSGLRAGESTTVRELLYGLMLPSGNDASVAFAEHFGARLGGKLTDDSDPLPQFVAAMNAKADELDLRETSFANPHGLTAKQHRASARDLAKLAAYAWTFPELRKVVATRQRGVTVNSISGYQRNVKWTNTNRLLATTGYHGLKTGTTSAAGACLISIAERDGAYRILVTLGSSSTDARYADSRNLHRWSWTKWPAQ